MTVRIVPCGDAAIMLDLGTLDEVLRLFASLKASPPRGVVDIVPGARSILVTCDPDVVSLERLRTWVLSTQPAVDATWHGAEVVEIDVRYDGEDLADVADLLRLDPREVIRLHTSSVWTVAFGGFAPGFGYLITDHDRLRVPRRSTPRSMVPSGSVALAGEFSGIYPRSSPGGWQIIGSTDAVLWDPASDRGALLEPGTTVRFREVTA